MATDVVERLKIALVSLVNASAAIQAITGRVAAPQRALVPWDNIGELPLPIIAYHVVDARRLGGTGDNREMLVQFSCFAEGAGASGKCGALVEVLETLFTTPLLATVGLDAWVREQSRRDGDDEPEGARNLRRADIDLTFWVTK